MNRRTIAKPRCAWNKPPLALIALFGAMFLAIVATAEPMVRIGLNSPTVPPEPSDVKIDCLAVRAGPTTQAMVRLLNQSDFSTAKLTIRADGKDAAPIRSPCPLEARRIIIF